MEFGVGAFIRLIVRQLKKLFSLKKHYQSLKQDLNSVQYSQETDPGSESGSVFKKF